MPKLTPNKESLEKAKILMKKPPRENKINMPIIDPSIKPSFIHEVDLLFLPNDNGYIYALVVVNIGSRICQAQPVKTKKSKDVLQAIRKIYNGKILKLPHQLQVDSGT